MYKTMWKSYVEKPGIKPAVKGNKKKWWTFQYIYNTNSIILMYNEY